MRICAARSVLGANCPLRYPTLCLAAGLWLLPFSGANAQSFNVDFGEPGMGPPSSYGGAGQPGFWNSIRGEHTTPAQGPQALDYQLTDVDGNLTGVGLHQFGGTELIWEGDPSISGDDAILMSDALLTHSFGIKSCLYFNGLENGTYLVTTYTWRPNHPEVISEVHHDNTPEHQFVGGAWDGHHEFEVTFAEHLVDVFNGFMGPHAGLANVGDQGVGAPLNGIQLKLLSPTDAESHSEDVVEPTLLAVQPNPFTQTTAVAFELPTAGPVRVAIVDANGRVVRGLVDETFAAGRHVIRWDGLDGRGEAVPRGVYFARFASEDVSSTKKMVLQ